jgi:hypothetical protein
LRQNHGKYYPDLLADQMLIASSRLENYANGDMSDNPDGKLRRGLQSMTRSRPEKRTAQRDDATGACCMHLRNSPEYPPHFWSCSRPECATEGVVIRKIRFVQRTVRRNGLVLC